jgi:2-keto-4-pentenoate hydratase/2-oxohepta-3-ene-1,7-dioic acid hydratase in catechol pathway
MRICRFDDDRLGLVLADGAAVADVTAALDALPALRWPLPPGDPLVANLARLHPVIERLAATAPRRRRAEIRLRSPVANPSKIIAAPVNYLRHVEEARADRGINFGADVKTIDHYGLFLKAATSLVGPGDGVRLPPLDRRIDHEVELAVIIGRSGYHVPRERAMEHVAGYAIALDMTVRGPEDRSWRKSFDSFAVLGPWLVTADEIADPGTLDLSLAVDGVMRQSSNTRALIFDVPKLVEYAAAAYTLYPGDIIMTGTPDGVAPVKPGDVMTCTIAGIGAMEVAVSALRP